MIKPIVVGFCSVGVHATLGLRTFSQFQGSEMSPGLFQDFIDGYIERSTLAVEHSVVVMTAGLQSRRSQIESSG